MVRRVRWLPLTLVVVAGCGSNADAPKAPTSVRGTLELRTAAAGPPDAGTRAGHGGDRFAAIADGPLLEIRGRVSPPDARMKIDDGAARRAHVNVDGDGRFRAALPALRPGRNLFELSATADGADPWRTEVLVTRSGGRRAGRVEVPQADRTPPQTILVVRTGGRVVSSVSPVRDHDEPPLKLTDPRIELEAIVRDPDGGTGRVRASLTYTIECPGQSPRKRTHYFPPSEIARVQIPPGRRARTERTRRATVTIDRPGPGCVARGEAWSDATNALGLESFSDQVAFGLSG